MARIISIVNQKGGVGKTTTAISLSASLAHKGNKVLLVDIDPQSNATSGLGIDKNYVEKSVYDVIINDMDINECILDTEQEKFKLCPSNIQLAGAEIELVPMISREMMLKNSIEYIKDDYDFIIIDCPPSLGLLTLNALTAAHSVLVPIQCEYYALEGLSQLMDTIKLIQKHLNKGLEVEGVVLTMHDVRTNLSVQVVEEVQKHFGNKVYRTIIPRNVRLSEAPSYGSPIILYDEKSKGTEAYLKLAGEIIKNSRLVN